LAITLKDALFDPLSAKANGRGDGRGQLEASDLRPVLVGHISIRRTRLGGSSLPGRIRKNCDLSFCDLRSDR